MDIEALKCFMVIAKEENFTKAAEKLNISQPTLSKRMNQLEEEFGVKFYHRLPISKIYKSSKAAIKTIKLTEDGQIFKRRAQEMLELFRVTQYELMDQDEDEIKGTISIGMGMLRSVAILPGLISSFREKYPLVKFDMLTTTADVSTDYLENGLLDLAILMEPIALDIFDFVRIPIQEEWCVIMRADDELASKESIRPVNMLGRPIILPSRIEPRKEIEQWFGRYLKRMDVVFTYNLPNNSETFVANRLGYTFSVNGSKEIWNPEYIVHKPLDPPMKATSVLAWKRDEVKNRAVTKFIEHCQEYITSVHEKDFENC